MCGEPLVADSNEDVGRWTTDGRQHKVVFVNALVSGDCREQNHLYRTTVNALTTREHAEGWQRKEHGDKHDTSDGERFRQSLRLEYQGAKDALS